MQINCIFIEDTSYFPQADSQEKDKKVGNLTFLPILDFVSKASIYHRIAQPLQLLYSFPYYLSSLPKLLQKVPGRKGSQDPERYGIGLLTSP